MDTASRLFGLPPVARGDARALLLGSFPGRRSLEAKRYYAHPQNRFWKLTAAATGPLPEGYEDRCRVLVERGLALRHVAHSCVRAGSLDADIRDEEANDIAGFRQEHPRVRAILFNGAKARQMFDRLVRPLAETKDRQVRFVTLPSSSPANARVSFEEKLAAWRQIGEVHEVQS